MRILVCKNYEEMSKKAAQMILSQITLKPNAVLGLATGSTPVGMYKNLVDMYNNGIIDFSEVTTFNLDEYCDLPREHPESYYSFMHTNLFNHIDIKEENVNIRRFAEISPYCIKKTFSRLAKERYFRIYCYAVFH